MRWVNRPVGNDRRPVDLLAHDQRRPKSIGDPFNFDAPTIGQQGTGPIRGLERWRFVATGTVKIPFDIRVTGFATISSGPSYGGVLCDEPNTAPDGGGCYLTNFGIYRPKGIGYKNVDFNVAKTFKLPWGHGHEVNAYLQVLNAFDFVNRNYSQWSGGFQTVGGPGPSLKHDSTGVASQGRSFKAGLRYSF